MTDTIDLLEALGRDACLRHASTEELGKVLAQAQASEALTAAVMTGDSTQLAREFGSMPLQSPQAVDSPAHEEEPEEELPLDGTAPALTPSPSSR